MLKENKPLVSEISSLSEVSGDKPNFVLVGEVTDELKALAGSKKAHMSFYTVASLEGHAAGTLVLVENGVATLSTTSGLEAFVNQNAYPLIGQLTPENYQFYMDRGLDLFWFGLSPSDTASVEAIREGVKNFADKYSYVWLDYEKFEAFMKQNMGCEELKCGVLVKSEVKYRLGDNGASLNAADLQAFLEKDAAGTLQNWAKSQPIPENPEENNVRVLVGSNFEQEVKGKNVFVFF